MKVSSDGSLEGGATSIVESAGNSGLSSCEKNLSVHCKYMNFLRQRKRTSETMLHTLRALLPQNASYAQQPDDDVYKKGTRRGRMQAEGALSGRSMVEMLGVLAIIGVLSVGAITGYQKAMKKYWLNKFLEGTTQLILNAKTIANTANLTYNADNTFDLTPCCGHEQGIIGKLNMVPEPYYFDGAFSLYFSVPFFDKPHSWSKLLINRNRNTLDFYVGAMDKELCHHLLTQDWKKLDYQFLHVKNGDLYPSYKNNLTIDTINQICDTASTDDESSNIYGKSSLILIFNL